MERTSEETLAPENTEERMADRPPSDDTDLNIASGSIDDTGPEPGGGPSIDDV